MVINNILLFKIVTITLSNESEQFNIFNIKINTTLGMLQLGNKTIYVQIIKNTNEPKYLYLIHLKRFI